ncbi:pH-response regulator protein palC, partial [Lentinula raphanica]
MAMFLYDLSTTGAISFSDFINHPSSLYTRRLSEATQLRSRLRGILKETKRIDGEKDYVTIIKVIDDYLPHLQSVMDCVAHKELVLKAEPVFSWRTTLSSSSLNISPKISLQSLNADNACSLLTCAFAHANLARTIVGNLGPFEYDRAISQVEREAKEEQLKHAISHLCQASGIFTYLSETILPQLQTSASTSKFKLPPDLLPEVSTALSRMSLAEAQTIAIRKLLSKSFYDSNIAPGPPLPKSHPAPGLIAKLHLECVSLYSTARTLAKTPSASSKSSEDVSPELRHYLADETALNSGLAKKWLGIDAGENGGQKRGGDAVGFLIWAKKELQEIKDGGKGAGLAKGDKERKDRNLRKEKVARELETIDIWLKHYKKTNDTIHFQPIPSQAELQSRIPTGVSAVFVTRYVPQKPAFGPDSDARMQKEQEMSGQGDSMPSSSTYAGAGEYY